MINHMNSILMSLLLIVTITKVYGYNQEESVPTSNNECPNDFATTCNIQCPNGNYLLDDKGCRMCACTPTERRPIVSCPQIKCRANCGSDGYQLDENGCQTCKCVSKSAVKCSNVMCRMFCVNGFKRDENGCEYCACNEKSIPCPALNCERSCTNGYRKDYSGCLTCVCDDEKDQVVGKCPLVDCNLDCKHGFQRDESDCQLCSCNSCPLQTCRKYCMYGFRRGDDGCEVCECDWTPVADKIPCSERVPCPGTRACNMQVKLCEAVNPENVNWFVFDFDLQTDMFQDLRFVQAFKNGFISNVAAKYGLQTTQIIVSAVEQGGLTSFQIVPFFSENLEIFEKKMDQIDLDLNTYEFRSVLPAVASVIETDETSNPSRTPLDRFGEKVKNITRKNTKTTISILALLLIFTAFIIGIVYINACHRRMKYRSGSKLPIFDANYQQTPTDDDHYHAVHAPDGTAYVVVETDDAHLSNDKRALV